MTRLFDRLRATLYCLAFGGTMVALWHSFGIDAQTIVHWCLAGWLGMAAVVLVAGLVVPVWEKAGQPSPPRQSRGAKAVPRPQVTLPAKSSP